MVRLDKVLKQHHPIMLQIEFEFEFITRGTYILIEIILFDDNLNKSRLVILVLQIPVIYLLVQFNDVTSEWRKIDKNH